ncbi:GNAT family N-acetyltransferase [Maribacter sp. 2304DJ31-5]|uniref:GNAT family N-acetyltransferase n=1 Tax=Maribacter sp. 2304DJ31-5 TaxID=3386273 RepID=UPI0039BD2AD8
MLDIIVKRFPELTTGELYTVLRLRTEVFVVEQNCIYQDLDGKDEIALHVIGKSKGIIVAYARIFGPEDYFEQASIGRVVVDRNERKYGYGKDIMNAAINTIYKKFHKTGIKLSAQCYLQQFYESLGFLPRGDSYLEDGIPHIAMFKN